MSSILLLVSSIKLVEIFNKQTHEDVLNFVSEFNII